MKKAVKPVVTVLVLLLAMVFGCTEGIEEEETKDDSPAGKGKISDWSIEQGAYNEYAVANLKIEEVQAADEKGVMGAVMRVAWGSSVDLRMCELYARLPQDFDYGKYDGVIFKVKPDNCLNIMVALRNWPIFPPTTDGKAGTVWKLMEEEYYYTGEWRTIAVPFSDAYDPGWGILADQSSLKEWLSANRPLGTGTRHLGG